MAGPAFFEGLVGADLVAEVMHMIGRRAQLVLKRVDEPLVVEIALFNSYPFMKPHMRCDDKFT